MPIFDAGSNNCSTAGKGFNDFLSVLSIGLVAGPTDDQCTSWKYNQALDYMKSLPSGKYDAGNNSSIMIQPSGEIDLINLSNQTSVLYKPNTITPDKASYIKEFFNKYKVEIGLFVIILIIMKL